MSQLSAWMHAIRPRTLPLALSSIITGSFIAAAENLFSWRVFLLAANTTILLQILSNLANDYGDFTKGTDKGDRIGPKRMVASGSVTPGQMILAISLVTILTFFSGISLIFIVTRDIGTPVKILFLLIGIGAVLAAIKYTVGRNPYGYHGLGDLFVFIFFGLVGVMGTCYLHTHQIKPDVILPAASIGLLSAGVLNLNNMRDYDSDKLAMKKTMVVIMGRGNAKWYHLAIIVGAIIAVIIYTILNYKSGFQFLFIIPVLLLVPGIIKVFKYTQPVELNSELRKLAMITLLFSVAFGLGLMI
ncbi:MAG: 1,4-dihydroxy-2-naphthoate polyprenyltransferase [Bacteroidales bacterium]|nr:1,4-dihydroxy-2-naphthoate polyprenyltransferase [Bacteroidales bacterium]